MSHHCKCELVILSLTHISVFGIPLAIWFGIATAVCLFSTVLLGILVMKGRYQIPFVWHMRAAAATITCALIHIVLVLMLYFS